MKELEAEERIRAEHGIPDDVDFKVVIFDGWNKMATFRYNGDVKVVNTAQQLLRTNPRTAGKSGSELSGMTFKADNTINMRKEETKQLKKPKVELMKDFEYTEDLFIPMVTDTLIDGVFSAEGGIMPATNYIMVGDGGIGKSTILMEVISKLMNKGKRCLFINAEMTKTDMVGYIKRFPMFAEIPMVHVMELEDDDMLGQIRLVLLDGYDIVLIDSFSELHEAIKESNKLSNKLAELSMINLMKEHNLANNDLKKYTSFLSIQQVGKTGTFLGTNKLKHNTTGMIEMRFDKKTKSRKIIITKNRRGFQYDELYFDIKDGVVVYNEALLMAYKDAQDIYDDLEEFTASNTEDFYDKVEKIKMDKANKAENSDNNDVDSEYFSDTFYDDENEDN